MHDRMKKGLLVMFAISVFLLLVILNYNYLDDRLTQFLKDYKTAEVLRVIDGDTIVTTDGEHIRLLGINAPETSSNEPYSLDAKQYLSSLVFNKTVKLETEGTDLYGRTLAYAFINNTNINIKLIEAGFANFYFPTSAKLYYREFSEAWKSCLDKNINLCRKSNDACVLCITLEKLDYEDQEVILHNNCSFSCNLTGWQIKDEGRKEFNFPNFILQGNTNITIIVGNKTNTDRVLYWKGYDYIWTSSGDTLFLRDRNHELVLWKNY
ncbi:MAG: thermonuclease family protein [Nanoarchaeota archaeon]|nr:thermonuclease family protein [Nanoarchaeota archaeon]